ncbi:proline-rich antigen homolog [Haliotis rufescens]|uniref:proline-rich antigen homolog n=1 Tax=Haliotis rufescens TaxID=6454 RepID=UPI00201F6AF6|nr:proline-rich antigen homolog [Haliotis rufescens]XP_048253036.1 proline-rich antigen homolog [Haliotis rufescens]
MDEKHGNTKDKSRPRITANVDHGRIPSPFIATGSKGSQPLALGHVQQGFIPPPPPALGHVQQGFIPPPPPALGGYR